MIRYLLLGEIIELNRLIMKEADQNVGLLNIGLLESAMAQPRMTFGGKDLYASLSEKAASIGFAIINNHPFADGNKRLGHAAMEPS